jgi:hypothetical protein
MTLRIVLGRIFHTNQGSWPISGKVEVWQGYIQSIRLTCQKMMINIDLGITTFYESSKLFKSTSSFKSAQ